MRFLKSFESTFLCLCREIIIFKIRIWADIFFASLYHAWTPQIFHIKWAKTYRINVIISHVFLNILENNVMLVLV
jgi:hypothetical protein